MERMLPQQKAIIVRGKPTVPRFIIALLLSNVKMIQLLCTNVPISKFKNQPT